MEYSDDPLTQFGLDAIDLKWTMKDIPAQRFWMINEAHVSKLIQLGLAEMREGKTGPNDGRAEHGLGVLMEKLCRWSRLSDARQT